MNKQRGRTYEEMFPNYRGVVLQNGHVDSITGPRCIVKMLEGPYIGRYIIAQTETVLSESDAVLVNERRSYPCAILSPKTEAPNESEASGMGDE